MKFKVGDKVKIVGNSGHHIDSNPQFEIGSIFEITSINETGLGRPYELNNMYCCEEWKIELADKKITKEELLKMPIGTKITTDLKEDNVFIKVYEETFSNEENGYIYDYNIEEDLSITDEDMGTKIIKIEEPIYKTVYDYTREVQEMTISEIEKVLGHKVKIINNEEEKII